MFTRKPKSLTAALTALLAGSMIFGASAPPRSQPGTTSRRDLPAFWKSRLEDVENSVGHVKKGTMSVRCPWRIFVRRFRRQETGPMTLSRSHVFRAGRRRPRSESTP